MEKRSCGALPVVAARKMRFVDADWRPGASNCSRSPNWRRFPRDRSSIGQLRATVAPSLMESSLFDANFENSEIPPEPLSFVLGRDHGGHWIVQEANGLCGGYSPAKTPQSPTPSPRAPAAEPSSASFLIPLNCTVRPDRRSALRSSTCIRNEGSSSDGGSTLCKPDSPDSRGERREGSSARSA